MPAEMFQDLADVYDALLDWPKRLANEEPFFGQLFQRAGVHRVLDAACGTGRHAAWFHSWGCAVEGADLSAGMIERCRRQFGTSDALRWVVRSFDQPVAAAEPFDAVICVGNSLSLAPEPSAVSRALGAMLAALRTGGVCVLQVLNLWHLPDGPCVWQKCKWVTLGGREHLLIKGVHRTGATGYVDLIDVLLEPAGATPRYDSTVLLGLEAGDLARAAREAGAKDVTCYGNYQRGAYQREQSQDLLLVIEK
jgi:glycine/sarcosine N-methyltransferase